MGGKSAFEGVNSQPPAAQQKNLEAFLQEQKDIPHSLPSSPDFAKLTNIGLLTNNSIPWAVVRPGNALQVSRLVVYLVANRIPFTVRSGGNNFFGKSQINNSVCIDLRSISFCEVNDGGKTARIGGGILFEKLIGDLQSKGYSAVTGMVPPIGFVGWSCYGGYGPFAWLHGLGHESILGAKVVDWRGHIIDADADLLKGIRGAGGGFGLLSGHVIFDESNTKNTVANICRETERQLLRDPAESLYMAPLFIVTPLGKAPFCQVMWLHEDQEQGKREIEKIAQLGPFVHTTVRNTTHLGAIDDFRDSFAMPGMIGNVGTISVLSLTEEVIDVIAHHVDIMPNEVGLGFAIHSTREAAQASCFPATERHFMLEFLGCVDSEEKVKRTDKWLKDFMEAIRGTNQASILPSTYVNLTAPGQNTLRGAYGPNYGFLSSLKKKYDPHGVFNTALPFVTLASEEELLFSKMIRI
ncbi:6-hydroxy-D-nicotine oxidase [Fusarium tjaetaba]|uniref:6-hydroxy-D-nicotine oxidase n=1 Tax=Fusarium tjaetaba TaxID=1567544 RepID=A0A8H5R1E2_9HYPO|nr:6-hydroxy-D-nicotine oxidase [Fusarium tjaetaba]KAF5624795.1 6-hydroxy-D-nicotine oxidase [Fusarium tjaetaba]